MDDANEWGPVASAVLEEIDDVVERRLEAFRDSLQEWLSGILAGPIPADWREQLEQFVEYTADQGLSIAPGSIDAIARIIESWISATDDAVSQSLTRKARSRIVDGAFVQSVTPSASGSSVLSRVAKSRPSTTTHHIRLGDFTDATQAVIKTLGSKWKYVSTDAMNRVRAAGALVDGQTGAVLGGDANSLGAEAFVRLEHRNGVIDTAHFRFVWTGSEPDHWQLVEIVRGATPERKAAELAAREKIRHDDVMRVRSGINRGQGGMFAIVGGVGGIVEGAPLLGTLEALGGAEQVGLAGLDVATGKEHRAWSARAVQAVLEGAGVDAETAQFLADHGGLLIALGRATADAAGNAHAVIETSTGYRIRLEFDPATLSANGLGGAKIKVNKLARDGMNVTGDAHGHHSIPQEIIKKLPAPLRKNPDIRGRAGLPNRRPVEAERHLSEVHDKTGISPKATGISGGKYNLRFQQEIEKAGGYKKVTKAQVLEIRDRLMKEFGL